MSSTQSTARPKRARTTRRAAGAARSNDAAGAQMLSAAERRALIAESAYLRAEQRGFSGGDPVADWLESEREVDALLARRAD